MTGNQSDHKRISYRSQIARSLAEAVDGNVQVLSKEQIATFGNPEWELIERLEQSDEGSVTVDTSSEEYVAAQKLAKCSMVNIEKMDDKMHQVSRKFSHTVVTVFES